jgi:hypothetical protein
MGCGGCRNHRAADVVGHRNAEPVAEWRANEIDCPPAVGTERVVIGQSRLTAKAQGRQDDIERSPPGAHQSRLQTPHWAAPDRGIVAASGVCRLRGGNVRVSYRHAITLTDLYANREP